MRADLENGRAAVNVNQPGSSGELVVESNANITAGADSEASQSAILDKLENKKQELVNCIHFRFQILFSPFLYLSCFTIILFNDDDQNLLSPFLIVYVQLLLLSSLMMMM